LAVGTTAAAVAPWHVALLAVAALAVGGWRLAAGDGPAPAYPVRRVLLTPGRLELELKRLHDGALAQMPRTEFEDLLQQAERAAVQAPPHLAQARYRAVLQGDALVGGGLWTVAYSAAGPGLLPLRPFNLALRQVRYENHDALVGEFDGRTPALLVESPGKHDVALEWSTRGEVRPEGLQFDLKLPPAAAAILELDLPAGRAVTALDGALVNGPLPAESADHSLWRVSVGGRTQVNLLVRPAAGPAADLAPITFVRQRTVQHVSSEGTEATFELALELGHPGRRELVVALDPGLRVRDVTAPQLDGWEVRPPVDGRPRLLVVRLRQPLREGAVVVSCLAPPHGAAGSPPAGGPGPQSWTWSSPGVRLQGAVPRGESLELWLHPDLRVESWDPGGFRVVDPGRGSSGSAGAGRWVQLSLVGGGIQPPGADLADRPRATLAAPQAVYHARQLLWWRLGPSGSRLTLQIAYDVKHGLLFDLPVRLPEGWVADRVETDPPGLLRAWSLRSRQARSLLLVELLRPLDASAAGARGWPPARAPVLVVSLRPAAPAPLTGRDLPFPDAVPVGARYREGSLAIDVDGQAYGAAVHTDTESVEPEEGPWGRAVPAYYYRFQGQPPGGSLRLQPRPAQLRAHCTTEVVIASGRAAFETRVSLQAEAGTTDVVDLTMPAAAGHVEWRAEGEPAPARLPGSGPVSRAERRTGVELAQALAVLGSGQPAQTASLFAARPPGEQWRLTLDRPLRGREPLRLYGTGRLEPTNGRWVLALPCVTSAAVMEGEVTLRLGTAEVVTFDGSGLREVPAPARGGPAAAWRAFQYGPGGATLLVHSRGPGVGRGAGASVGRASLVTYLGPGGLLQHVYRFDVTNWPTERLVLRLPPGARTRAARVDGRWLPGAAADESAAGEVEVQLPLPRTGPGGAAEGHHRAEVLYTSPAPSALLWARLQAPAPQLPVSPTVLSRAWRLPPGVVPLRDADVLAVPGEQLGQAEVAPWSAADLFHPPGVPGPWSGPPTDPAQVQTLAGAAFALRHRRAGPILTLRELVGALAFEYLGERFPLVVDTAALREAGLSPASAIPCSGGDQSPWEAAGLAVLPAGGPTLMTTLQQLRTWGWRLPGAPHGQDQGRHMPAPVAEAVGRAVGRAVGFGQDPSGRFRNALVWLWTGADARPDGETDPPLASGLGMSVWARWEPVAGTDDDALTIVHAGRVSCSAIVLTALLALAGWCVRHWRWRMRLTLLLGGLVVAGAGLSWLPNPLRPLAWWPLAAGCATALAWFLLAARRTPVPLLGKPATTTAALGVLLAGWALHANDDAAAPVTVFLLPGEQPRQQSVLAPVELVNRLRARVGRAPGATPAAVLLAATYDGKAQGSTAEFAANFAVHCTSDEPPPLALPLDGVQLTGGVWVDGAPAHAVPRPAGGYAVAVHGRGRHKVELRFRAPLDHSGDAGALLMTLPPAAQSRLVFRPPSGTGYCEALPAHGAQSVMVDAAGRRLEADLGRLTAPLRIRWSAERPSNPRVQFRAAYLWDIRADASSLQALVHYHVSGGAVTRLAIGLPADLELRAVEARADPAAADPAAVPPRVRGWGVEAGPGGRRLSLDLAAPVAEDFDVLLELVPRTALPATAVLSLPVPQGEHQSGDSHLAYRNVGVEARRGQLLNVTAIRPAEFAPFWPESSRPDPRSLAYACTLRAGAVVRLHLSPAPPAVDVEQEVSYRIGTARIEVRATAILTAPDRDMACAEWDLRAPAGFRVAGISGPDVRTWTQAGGRVLVWLRRPAGRTRLELVGWMPRPSAGAGTESRLELPAPRLLPARTHQTRVLLGTTPEWMLTIPSPLPGLQPLPRRVGQTQLVLRASSPNFRVAVLVRPAVEDPPQVRALTVVELQRRHLKFIATVEYLWPRGGSQRVQVRLRNWNGPPARLDAPGAVRSRLQEGVGHRFWEVDLPQGAQGTYRLTVSGERLLDEETAGMDLPEVTVPDARPAGYWLAVVSAGLAAEARGPLQPLADPRRDLAAWAGTADQVRGRGVTAWKVTGPGWQVRLRPMGPADDPAGRVLLCEHTAAVIDGGRWLHEAVWWLQTEAHTDLTVVFPSRARVVGLAVDADGRTPLQPARDSLWLPLPGRTGVCRVRVDWLYDDEPLQTPRLDQPRLPGVAGGPCTWTAYVPPGWEPFGGEPAGALVGAVRIAILDLHRARAELEFVRNLGDAGPRSHAALRDARRRFARGCGHAEQALRVGAGAKGVTGPAGQGLSEWLESLQKAAREVAARYRFDSSSTGAEATGDGLANMAADEPVGPGRGDAREDVAAILSERGTPRSWFGARGAAAPPLRLVRIQDHQDQVALAGTAWWLALAAVAWVVAMLRPLAAGVLRLWPELIAVTGAWGWYLAGSTSVVLLLLVLGLAGRLLLLAEALHRRHATSTAPAAPSVES
jgi:hypothetical protein